MIQPQPAGNLHAETSKLETIQRHAALMITRRLKSTPTANLDIMAGLQPTALKLQETAIKAALLLKLH